MHATEGNVMLYEHPGAIGAMIATAVQLLPFRMLLYVMGNSKDHPQRLAYMFNST